MALSAALTDAGIIGNQSSGRDRGGFVSPCSLDGVNPAYHPEVFTNAATAAQFGFVQGPGGVWHGRPGCHR